MKYKSLIEFSGKYVYKETSDEKLQKVLDRGANKLLKNAFILNSVLGTTYGAFLFVPLYVYFTYGPVMVVPIEFPLIDPTTTWGYFINVINQVFISHATAGICFGNDNTFVMMINSLQVCADVIKYSLDEMEEILASKTCVDRTERARKFRNLLVQVQDLDR